MIASIQRGREKTAGSQDLKKKTTKSAPESCKNWDTVSVTAGCRGDRICSLNLGKLAAHQKQQQLSEEHNGTQKSSMFSFQTAEKQENVTRPQEKKKKKKDKPLI